MTTGDTPRQRIVRLTPLNNVHAVVDRCLSPVAVRAAELADALGRIVAEDVRAPGALPVLPSAIRDGWAVNADLVADAGPYAPVLLAPPPCLVEHGDALPADCNAVLPPDAVVRTPAGYEAIAPAAPGEGVLPGGFDALAGRLLVHAGARLRASDIAALRAAGVSRVSVRAPRITIVAARQGLDAAASFVAAAIAGEGGIARCAFCNVGELSRAIAASDADAIVTIGGTGQGGSDRTAETVASVGELVIHGVGIRPGDSAGFGAVAGRPILLLPGRLDAALAAWLLVGRRMLQRLAGAAEEDTARPFVLTRKIASGIGLAEIVLVRRVGGGIEPIATGVFSLHALAQASGWVLVPPESEGYPSGATVDVHPLP